MHLPYQLVLWALVSVLFAMYHFMWQTAEQRTALPFCYRAYAVSRPFMHMACMQFANQAHALSLQVSGQQTKSTAFKILNRNSERASEAYWKNKNKTNTKKILLKKS